MEPGETNADALRREIRERLDAEVEVGALIHFRVQHYEHYTIDFYLHDCELRSEELVKKAVNDFKWVTSPEFEAYDFTPVDEASLSKLLGEP